MFDVGASELLLIVIVAIVVIGPKDLPRAMRLAGQWIAKIRRISGHFRAGIETMIREAELEEMERKWREQNAAIMQAHPPEAAAVPAASAEAASAQAASAQAASAEAASAEAAVPVPSPVDVVPVAEPAKQEQGEPQLPLPPP
jgi:sec-independent protein translocase protein TatB